MYRQGLLCADTWALMADPRIRQGWSYHQRQHWTPTGVWVYLSLAVGKQGRWPAPL